MQRLVLLLSLIGILGCSPTIIQSTPGKNPTLRGIAASDLIGALQINEDNLKSIDALGKISVATPDNRLRASQVVLAQSPNAFRIEVLAPFGISYAIATNGETLAALSTQEDVVYRGRPDPQTIADMIGIALSPRDMASLLLGRPPVEARKLASLWTSNPPKSDTPRRADTPAVFLHAADGADNSIVIGFAPLRTSRHEQIVPISFQRIARNGQSLLQASFEDFSFFGKILIPRRIRLSTTATEAVIEYTEINANKLLAAGVFQIETPPGTREILLDPAGR